MHFVWLDNEMIANWFVMFYTNIQIPFIFHSQSSII